MFATFNPNRPTWRPRRWRAAVSSPAAEKIEKSILIRRNAFSGSRHSSSTAWSSTATALPRHRPVFWRSFRDGHTCDRYNCRRSIPHLIGVYDGEEPIPNRHMVYPRRKSSATRRRTVSGTRSTLTVGGDFWARRSLRLRLGCLDNPSCLKMLPSRPNHRPIYETTAFIRRGQQRKEALNNVL